jgi:hypothetical protein
MVRGESIDHVERRRPRSFAPCALDAASGNAGGTHYLRSNQLRLYFSSLAYVLLQMLRRLGLAGRELAKAPCATIRLRLLKIGALIRITVRKVWASLAGGYPYVTPFR